MPEAMHRAQHFTRHLDFRKNSLAMRIRTTIQPVYKAIHPWPRVEDIDRAKHLPFNSEIDFNRIVHPAATVDAHVGPIGPTRENVRTFALTRDLTVLVTERVAVKPVAPVETPVRTRNATMYAGRVAGETEFFDDHIPLVRNTVSVGVLQSPDAGWRGNIKRSIVPRASHGKRHSVGEHGALVKSAVAIKIFQQPDRVG